jgi:hypothetical protein
MVRLTVVPVIPLAWSDAMNTAMLATSSTAMTRFENGVLPWFGLPRSTSAR